jgi:ABC transporter substrate binding protein
MQTWAWILVAMLRLWIERIAVAFEAGRERRAVISSEGTSLPVSEIESAITAFARDSNGGLIVLGSSLANVHRELIITLAARHRLPAVYSDRIFVTSGGLISYGPNRIDQFQRGAVYVDRILKGEKPADLPVQAPTKYELFINLKTESTLTAFEPGASGWKYHGVPQF